MRRVILKIESEASRFDGQKRATLVIEQTDAGRGLVTVRPHRGRNYTTTLEEAAACVMARAVRQEMAASGSMVPGAGRRR
jgi:hypothetical protein